MRTLSAETLGGEWRDEAAHRYLVVERRYAPGHRHGRVAVVDCLPPWPQLVRSSLGLRRLRFAPRGSRPLLFLDLETTGLAGGAGTYAFLVGCAWFDGAVFRTRQFFLSSYAAERALLEAVAGEAARGGRGCHLQRQDLRSAARWKRASCCTG